MARQKDSFERCLTLVALVAAGVQGVRMYRKIKGWDTLASSPKRAATAPEGPIRRLLSVRENFRVVSTAEYFFKLEETILAQEDRSRPCEILVFGLTSALGNDPAVLAALVERINARGRKKGYEISLDTMTEVITVNYL